MRVFNFSAGPSMLFEEVLSETKKQLENYDNTGMSVMEMSHRSAPYETIHNEFISLFRELTGLPDTYAVLLLQGGASMQFEAVPLNLLKTGKADYLVTGNFSKKAFKESKKYGDIACAGSGEDKNFTYIPDFSTLRIRDGIDYFHMCTNNTIFGTKCLKVPQISAPTVADMSSNILSEIIDYTKYGVVYAGAQKNIGPAGLTLVLVKKELLDQAMPICPTMLRWKTHADENSLYNTPSTFSIFVSMLTLRHIKRIGGVSAMQEINFEKAKMLYDFIDNSKLFKNNVNKADRSVMNVTFVTGNDELDKKFVKESTANGLVSLKGHRLVGGMRASIYNAMPIGGVKKLVEFMKKFEVENV